VRYRKIFWYGRKQHILSAFFFLLSLFSLLFIFFYIFFVLTSFYIFLLLTGILIRLFIFFIFLFTQHNHTYTQEYTHIKIINLISFYMYIKAKGIVHFIYCCKHTALFVPSERLYNHQILSLIMHSVTAYLTPALNQLFPT